MLIERASYVPEDVPNVFDDAYTFPDWLDSDALITQPLFDAATDTIPAPAMLIVLASNVPEEVPNVLLDAYAFPDWFVCVGTPMEIVLPFTEMLTAPVADRLEVAGALIDTVPPFAPVVWDRLIGPVPTRTICVPVSPVAPSVFPPVETPAEN
jgi:hypothetical protein